MSCIVGYSHESETAIAAQDAIVEGFFGDIVHTVTHVAKRAVSVSIAMSPVNLVKHVIKGERIDRAIVSDLKDKVKGAREAAPYIQTVVSLVPGVGTGVAGAIAASAALAAGHKITDVLIEAAKGAVPGGAAAQTAFDVGVHAVQGENVGVAALNAARNKLPPAARGAFDIGLALAHGKKLQEAAKIGGKTYLRMSTDALAKRIPGIGNVFVVKPGALPLHALSTAAKLVHVAHNDADLTKRRFAQTLIGRTYVAAKRGDPDALKALQTLTTAKKGLVMAHARKLRTLDPRVKAHVAANAPTAGVLIRRHRRGSPVVSQRGTFVRERGGVDGTLIVKNGSRYYHIRGHFKKVA